MLFANNLLSIARTIDLLIVPFFMSSFPSPSLGRFPSTSHGMTHFFILRQVLVNSRGDRLRLCLSKRGKID